MRWLGSLLFRVIAFFAPGKMDRDLNEEVAFHLEMETRKLVEEGISETEARQQARRNFGGVDRQKDRARDSWGVGAAQDLKADVRLTWRQLRKNPAFAIIAVLTLALGIGGTTAIFSVVKRVLLQPLPYPEPDRLVTLWSQEDWPYGTNAAEYLDIRAQQATLTDIAIYAVIGRNLAGPTGEPLRATAAIVTGGFFPILGVAPALGRSFGDEEDAPGENSVVVLRHGFWLRQFGGDSSVIGQSLLLDDRPYTIIGVMPPGFSFPDETSGTWSPGGPSVQMWIPAGVDPARPGGRGGHGIPSVARLKPGVELGRASEDIRRISLAMHEEYPDEYDEAFRGGWTLRLEPLSDAVVGDARPALLILLGAVGLVLLVACGNVANLLLARGKVREKELALRRALGAVQGRLIRQLLTESTVLSLLGGVAGMGLALWGLPGLLRLAPADVPRLASVQVDSGVLVFALAISILTGILAGLAPALYAARGELYRPLREGSGGSGPRGAGRLRRTLVTLEVAITLVLLVGAGLLIRSLSNLRSLDPGYSVENVLTFRLTLPPARYATQEARVTFFDELLERLKGQPGVQAAGAISQLPLARDFSVALMAEGMPSNQKSFPHGLIGLSAPRAVTPGYSEAMGLNLLQGRFIEDHDRSNAPLVAIVSDEFARLAWPGTSAVGKRVAFPSRSEPEWRTVVGVVRDTREEAGTLASERYRDAYFPLQQAPTNDMYFALKVTADPTGLAPLIRREVASMDPNLPLYELRSMAEVLRRATARSVFNARLMAIFAAIALLLGAVGVYGVTSYAVDQRRREIGIRLALGAPPWVLLGGVLRSGMAPVLAGLALGVAGAFGITRLLQTLLYGVSASDPATFGAVVGILSAVAVVACYVPARRAASVDPTEALRRE